MPGFAAVPAPFADGLHRVIVDPNASSAPGMVVSQRFATRGWQLFRRTGPFPPHDDGAAASMTPLIRDRIWHSRATMTGSGCPSRRGRPTHPWRRGAGPGH